jgi:uncharacterized protein
MTDTIAAPALPDTVLEVLRAAAAIVATRPSQGIDPEKVLNHPQGVAHLLALLEQSAALRVATATNLRGRLPGHSNGLAAGLVADDVETAQRAVGAVRALLSKHRRAAKRASRQAERDGRASVEERQEARAVRRLAEVREARDRARAQAKQAESEASALRREVADLTAELSRMLDRAEAAETRLASARRAADDPVQAAASFAAALAPQVDSRFRDSRGVGPGEPARVDPGRSTAPSRVDVSRLVEAAGIAGLAADVAETVGTWLPALFAAYVTPPRLPAQVRERVLQVAVLGGGRSIGGSCVLITAGDTRLLIDAGTRPTGRSIAEMAPERIDQAVAGPLHGIVVTHAHNDHAGWVPALLIDQPGIPVFATSATAALLAMMWLDSAKVLARRGDENDAADASLAPYLREDVKHALEQVREVPFGTRTRIGDVEVELFPAGHIIGGAGVVVHAYGRRVVVSGDVSRPGQSTVGGVEVPESAKGADLLLLESTYGGSGRMPHRSVEVGRLVDDVAAVTGAGGRVLIPAFALGRAQEVAHVLASALPDTDVLIDGLARDVTTIYEQYAGPKGEPLRIFGKRVRPVQGTRRQIASMRSGVVIATSGMLAAGPAVAWAEALLPDPASGVMLVGYQGENSPGARLLGQAERGGEFELPGSGGFPVRVPVNARVGRYGLGAHATADELVSISAEVAAKAVMLVHGTPAGQAILADRLRKRGQRVVPAGEWTSAG